MRLDRGSAGASDLGLMGAVTGAAGAGGLGGRGEGAVGGAVREEGVLQRGRMSQELYDGFQALTAAAVLLHERGAGADVSGRPQQGVHGEQEVRPQLAVLLHTLGVLGVLRAGQPAAHGTIRGDGGNQGFDARGGMAEADEDVLAVVLPGGLVQGLRTRAL